MSLVWDDGSGMDLTRPDARGWLQVARRGLPAVLLTFGCLLILLLVRLVERPIHGVHRPWTPFITQFVCRNVIRLIGMDYKVSGTLMRERGAVVANHASWLDIFALNATKRVYFVSKSEVARWPFIGWLARATGTVFINRDRREAAAQKRIFEDRLLAGHKLLFFPEGTSTDGRRVLEFKPTLFAAFFAPGLREQLHVQPVSVIYHAPEGADPRHYGWWGEMEFAPHLLHVLAAPRQGRVELVYHAPLKVADFPDRKALARACGAAVRRGHAAALGQDESNRASAVAGSSADQIS